MRSINKFGFWAINCLALLIFNQNLKAEGVEGEFKGGPQKSVVESFNKEGEIGIDSAKMKNKLNSSRVKVLRPEAEIFSEPHFDSSVVSQAEEGKVFFSSSIKFNGVFYKILLGKSRFGYIPDSDVKLITSKVNSSEKNISLNKNDKKNTSDASIEDIRSDSKSALKTRKKVFSQSHFVGVSYNFLQYKETTMGDHQQESLGFLGFKISGPDLLIEGPIPTEINILFYPGAPGFYEKKTGRGASGLIFMLNGMWQNYFPMSRAAFGIIGFGPVFKYSKYRLGLVDANSGSTNYYGAEEMSLGFALSAGGALKLGPAALRLEYTYYWEKEAYGGLNLSLQKDF